MKEIRLKADPPLHNYVDVAVMDFPDGPDGRERQRCKVTVEFAEFDVKQLKKRGMDFAAAMKYYRQWLYEVVKYHIAQDWQCKDGFDEVMEIVEEKVKRYY